MTASGSPALRVALIGCGRWGVHVLRDLRQCGCRVTVVARSEASRANAVAGGAERVVGAIEDLPGAPDAAVVVTPALTHVEVIERLLERWPNLPVYSEKPLCVDPQRAARAARDWPRVYVMHKWRYHPGVLALAAIARSGELGPVECLRLHREQWGAPQRDIDPVRTTLVHDLSITLEILGWIPEIRAARIDRHQGVPFGATAILGSAPWVAITMSARSATPRREVQLVAGDGVALLAGSYAKDVRILRRPPEAVTEPAHESRPIAGTMPLLAEIAAFLAFVRGEGPPPKGTLAEEAAIVGAMAEAFRLAEG